MLSAETETHTNLERYFKPFRENIIGINQDFESPYGIKKIVYADWTASGRLYGPIEKMITETIAPFVGNTHTETTVTGSSMTAAYHKAKHLIKKHVNAYESDILISSNSGMTGVVNKFQRILGLKLHEKFANKLEIPTEERPVVFVTHMEHHSNQTSWLETIAEVRIIEADEDGLVNLNHLDTLLNEYKDRQVKIAAVTSCSNVTGIFTPYHDIAEKMHKAGGFCFVDFACAAPYIKINMRPENKLQQLDAVYFSPHKFLGGPSSTGILIFDPSLYTNKIPDNPGGGTVDWTNPWGEHKYYDEVEAREDGGTPAFIQTIRVALCCKLKEDMGIDKMMQREKEIVKIVWPGLKKVNRLHLLADEISERLCVFSFYIEDLHYNLGVKILNDRFGVQVRGGCSCAGTYGHYLLHVSQEKSNSITNMINLGDLSNKPGWIRLSIHPVMTDEEINFILDAIYQLSVHHEEWTEEYAYDPSKNEFFHKRNHIPESRLVDEWFDQKMI
jgi:selenocysteine lyase/cysteine desulfurase